MSGKVGMKRYTLDFRMTVIQCHLKENIINKELADRFGIHTTQAHLWVKWYHQYGTPMKITGAKKGRPKKDPTQAETATKKASKKLSLKPVGNKA